MIGIKTLLALARGMGWESERVAELHREALDVAERHFGVQHAAVALVMSEMAEFYDARQDGEQARRCRERMRGVLARYIEEPDGIEAWVNDAWSEIAGRRASLESSASTMGGDCSA